MKFPEWRAFSRAAAVYPSPLNLVAADVRRLTTPNPKSQIPNPKSEIDESLLASAATVQSFHARMLQENLSLGEEGRGEVRLAPNSIQLEHAIKPLRDAAQIVRNDNRV